MDSSEPRSLRFSVRLYTQLLGIYPAHFLNQFGDQIIQTHADMARRAMRRGGIRQLLLLWMRILPDLGRSAIREHLNLSSWTAPARLRWRWVVACSLGCGVGYASGVWASSSGEYLVPPLLFMLVLGLFQSLAGLKLPAGVAAGWTLATTVSIFLIPVSLQSVLPASWFLLVSLRGLSMGFCQFLVLRKLSSKAWHWIPANAFGSSLADLAIVLIVSTQGPYPEVSYLLPFATGALFGCLTAMPLVYVLPPTDGATVEGAVQA
jgi:hypothetical protein